MKENKSINLTDEVNKKSQKQNKNETNRNKNIIINRASTNIPNDSNENNLKDSINRMQKDNLKSNINCNNNFQKYIIIFESIIISIKPAEGFLIQEIKF